MLFFKKLHLFQLLFSLQIIFAPSISQKIPLNQCGNIKLQPPFSPPNTSNPSLLTHMILCKSNILYFKTSIGLFQISSINYTNKHLIISHKQHSSTSKFVSPNHLSAGFPSPSTPNSLILFNCSKQSSNTLFMSCNDYKQSSCSVIDDVEKLGGDFNPNSMNCTHYSRVYKINEKYEIGTRVSFDVPDHVPNPCDECERANGNCGVGLRCVCHPRLCKDRVVSYGAAVKPCGNILIYMISFFMLMNFF